MGISERELQDVCRPIILAGSFLSPSYTFRLDLSALLARLQASQLEQKVQEGRNANAISLGAALMAQQAMDSVDAGVQQMKDDWVQRRLEEEKQVCDTCSGVPTCIDWVCKVSVTFVDTFEMRQASV